jgi:peptidyl-dipeptidase Dcp
MTSSILFSSCKQKTICENDNPFFCPWETPFEVPPFEEIKNEHYLPAFEEGIKRQTAEIDAIIASEEEPTFENTILPLDKSGEFLTRVAGVFYNLNSANTNDTIQELAQTISPMLSKHRDNISMNPELFKRVKAVYDNKDNAGLDASQLRALEIHYRGFDRNGANLNEEDQQKLREYNEKLTKLTLDFAQNLLAETNKTFKLVIDNKADLAGLSDAIISGAAETAKASGMEGKWVFTLQKPSLIPFLQYAENRDLREKIYRGYFMRGNNNNKFDNKDILEQIAAIRADKAKLFGFNNYAEYAIDINMAKTPANVNNFLNKLWEPALEISKKEVKEMQAIIDAEGGNFELASWDWWYYAEKLRKQKYDLDESQITPYFKLENVRDGMFWVANQLYGITLTKVENAPKYHKDVELFEVNEANGDHIGVLYLDFHPRNSKRPGAWCTDFRAATYKDGKKVDPVMSIVCNFTKPTDDLPALLTWDEVTTMFHEFGHALHFLFVDGKYNATAGLVARDYVELPSQIMENFASEPQVLKHFAKHYETGEVIPDELIEKIVKSGHFNQGFMTVEYLAASLLDLDYHMLTPGETIDDALKFEKESMNKIGLIKEILPRYRSTYFGHIFSGSSYSAGYYVYIWAAQLDADAFDAFKQSGDIFNKDLAAKFRKHCLEECGEDEGMVQYIKFRGQEPSIEPLLERRGLK